MNERIKQLAQQADQYERKLGKGIGMTRDEKFAELIVQDCVWLFGETRTEPSLERFILTRLGIDHE